MKSHSRRSATISALIAAGLILGLALPSAASEAKHLISGSQIKPHTITGKQIKDHALTAKQVKKNALTGAEVKESTLGTVPNSAELDGNPSSAYQRVLKNGCPGSQAIVSTAADGTVTCSGNLEPQLNANCTGRAISSIYAGGTAQCTSGTVVPFYFILSATSTPKYKFGNKLGDSGLVLDIACHDPGTQLDFADRTDNNATINWSYSTGGSSSTVNASGAVISANDGNAQIFHFEGARLEGQFILAVPSGTAGQENVVTVNMHAYDGGSYCEYIGTAEVGTASTS